MGKDVIIGVVDNYDWDKIKYWANSIKQSGFDGHKALIVYNMNAETSKKLSNEGFIVVGCNEYSEEKGFSFDTSKRSIMVDRFFNIHNFLNMLQDPTDVERVIITDVRDVVFQVNPTEWLNTFFLPQYNLLVGSENMLYKDEPWGRNNILQSFGEYFYDRLKDERIICAGVIAGTLEDVRDLCLTIWMVCRNMNPHVPGGGGPDQAALNILLDTVVHKYTTFFTDPVDGWVVHAGTSMDAVRAGSGGIGEAYLKDPSINLPFVNNIEYSVINNKIAANQTPLTIVHQWDRVPAWKKLIEEKYGTI
jgi:hypothetical protein